MQEITALRRAEQRISFSYGLTYAVLSVPIFSTSAHSLHRAVAVRSSIVQGPDMVLGPDIVPSASPQGPDMGSPRLHFAFQLFMQLFGSSLGTHAVDAMDYKTNCSKQVYRGREFLERTQCVKEGQSVLDLGCGTGQLSAYVAELVGPEGKVTGVDPDERRVQLAMGEYGDVKNLGFSVGSSHQFPNMEEPTYDLIISCFALHWIPHKEHVFRNAFRALKPRGKFAVMCTYEMIPVYEKAVKEVFCGSEDLLSTLQFEDMAQVERFCVESGFVIEKCFKVTHRETFDTKLEFCEMFSAVFHGRADLSLATPERLQRFSPPIEEGKVIMEVPKILQLVAAKPNSPE